MVGRGRQRGGGYRLGNIMPAHALEGRFPRAGLRNLSDPPFSCISA
jgi:hypothetical protein